MSSLIKEKIIADVFKEEQLLYKLFMEVQGADAIGVIYYEVEDTIFIVGDSFSRLATFDLGALNVQQHRVGSIVFGTTNSNNIRKIREALSKKEWILITGTNKFL